VLSKLSSTMVVLESRTVAQMSPSHLRQDINRIPRPRSSFVHRSLKSKTKTRMTVDMASSFSREEIRIRPAGRAAGYFCRARRRPPLAIRHGYPRFVVATHARARRRPWKSTRRSPPPGHFGVSLKVSGPSSAKTMTGRTTRRLRNGEPHVARGERQCRCPARHETRGAGCARGRRRSVHFLLVCSVGDDAASGMGSYPMGLELPYSDLGWIMSCWGSSLDVKTAICYCQEWDGSIDLKLGQIFYFLPGLWFVSGGAPPRRVLDQDRAARTERRLRPKNYPSAPVISPFVSPLFKSIRPHSPPLLSQGGVPRRGEKFLRRRGPQPRSPAR
jgi:hypothetical protein